MVEKLIGVVALVILAVYLVTTFVTGSTGSMKSESTRLGNDMIQNMQSVESGN